MTLNSASWAGPKLVDKATSAASRPRAISIRPIRGIVPRVEGIPTALQKHLEPGTEIHRVGNRRHADITEIAGAVARRDIHAAAQCDREMGKVAAHAEPS